jgi:hypothetical protein
VLAIILISLVYVNSSYYNLNYVDIIFKLLKKL